ncbi:protein GPR107-like [Iris pallida]|uniref:Protein GPR107-like n=1 Tax=Iris pallida TaxID=29817 RepID=A0AAX6ILF1_IRIPA|nr:protein GPR107-like [Iris pallida]
MVVVPLQVLTNVASVAFAGTGPFAQDRLAWRGAFVMVDFVCCFLILSPVVWSIRRLRETSKTDGKAARNLAKLLAFRKFYIVVIGYLYFTRVVVLAIRTIVSYEYRWVSVVVEAVGLAFYVFVFYMFRPKEKNEYFALDDDIDEEAAMVALREEGSSYDCLDYITPVQLHFLISSLDYQTNDEDCCDTYYGADLVDTCDLDPQEDPVVAEDLPLA